MKWLTIILLMIVMATITEAIVELAPEGGVINNKGNNIYEWSSDEASYFEITNSIEGIELNLLGNTKQIKNIVKPILAPEIEVSKLSALSASLLNMKSTQSKEQYNYTLNNNVIENFQQEFWDGCNFNHLILTCPFYGRTIIVDFTPAKELEGKYEIVYDNKKARIIFQGDLSKIDPTVRLLYSTMEDNYLEQDVPASSNWNTVTARGFGNAAGDDDWIVVQLNLTNLPNNIRITDVKWSHYISAIGIDAGEVFNVSIWKITHPNLPIVPMSWNNLSLMSLELVRVGNISNRDLNFTGQARQNSASARYVMFNLSTNPLPEIYNNNISMQYLVKFLPLYGSPSEATDEVVFSSTQTLTAAQRPNWNITYLLSDGIYNQTEWSYDSTYFIKANASRNGTYTTPIFWNFSNYNRLNITTNATTYPTLDVKTQIREYNFSNLSYGLNFWMSFDDSSNNTLSWYGRDNFAGGTLIDTNTSGWDLTKGGAKEELAYRGIGKGGNTRIEFPSNSNLTNKFTMIAFGANFATSISGGVRTFSVGNSSSGKNTQVAVSYTESNKAACMFNGTVNQNFGVFRKDYTAMLGCIYNGTHFAPIFDGKIGTYVEKDNFRPNGLVFARIMLGQDTGVSGYWNGTIDNIGYWNYSWSTQQLLEYNKSFPRWQPYKDYQDMSNGVSSKNFTISDTRDFFQARFELQANASTSSKLYTWTPKFWNFTYTPPTDSCTYDGTGDWLVDAADNCVITTVTRVESNYALKISGTGSFRVEANIYADDFIMDLNCRFIDEAQDGAAVYVKL